MKTKLIALTGKARSGKDTTCRHLAMRHGFVRTAFADPLKMAAQQVFGLTEAQTWDEDKKEDVIPYWGLSPRQMFQKIGDALRAEFGDDVFVKRWKMGYDLLKHTDNVVVTDLRTDTEDDCLRELGAVVVEVRRGTGLVGSTGAHPTEKGISTLPDYVINNDGSLEDLRGMVDDMMREGV